MSELKVGLTEIMFIFFGW